MSFGEIEDSLTGERKAQIWLAGHSKIFSCFYLIMQTSITLFIHQSALPSSLIIYQRKQAFCSEAEYSGDDDLANVELPLAASLLSSNGIKCIKWLNSTYLSFSRIFLIEKHTN